MRSYTDDPAGGRPPGGRCRGQALVEAAIVLPLGLLLLLTVGYLGRGLIERQDMLIAARYAAREAALGAMRTNLDKLGGAEVIHEAMTAAVRDQAAQQATQRPVQVSPPDWNEVMAVGKQQLQPAFPSGPYGMAFLARSPPQTLPGLATPVRFGLGFMLYGAKVSERVSFLEPVRKQTNAVASHYSHQGGPLLNPLVVSGTAFMPSEAPIHCAGPAGSIGLLESNQWIWQIIRPKS
ncbi:MAG: pilus assembly protein [Cyanobacteria bacterium REEB65]|nr:pilus assembly protein [Cyanobacteria bacterium REEB65]